MSDEEVEEEVFVPPALEDAIDTTPKPLPGIKLAPPVKDPKPYGGEVEDEAAAEHNFKTDVLED